MAPADPEMDRSLELANQLKAILEGENIVSGGAAIGHVFSGWLMMFPADQRENMADSFVKFALSVCRIQDEKNEHTKN